MDNTTNIQDAKAFKRMGVPLNTPVETRYFSATYSKRWFALDRAHDEFMLALYDCDGTVAKWKRLKMRFNGINKAMNRCNACIGKLDDPMEVRMMGAFLIQRAIPFATYWADAINAVDDGATLTIMPADIPPWTAA